MESMGSRVHAQGFTIIELIVVISLLAILAAIALPRFINVTEDAHEAAVEATGGAFSTGVQLVHSLWVTKGSPGAVLNFVALADTRAAGDLSVNTNGWPADTRGVSLTLNSTFDCEDVWNAVMVDSAPSVSDTPDADYLATYLGNNACRYTYQANTQYSITYDSNTGDVTTIIN